MPGTSRPAWVRDAIFYQIFPDRFARSSRVPKLRGLEPWGAPPKGHGYQGGDLLGIVERLDWLSDLGVDALYLNPIFQSGSNHRYHTFDYHAVDPMLGGNAALDELLAAAHQRGMRVVLDGVFNHASRGFFPFHDVLENGAASPYVDWFHIQRFPLRPYSKSRPAGYGAWWNLRALPKINTDHPEAREYLMQVGERWARAGIDGWRLDVPEEITTEGFWEEFRERMRAIRSDLYLVGEIWHDALDWIGDGSRFDGTMNYPFASAAIAFAVGERLDRTQQVDNPDYAVWPPTDGTGYRTRIDDLLGRYPLEATLSNLNLLDSHDTARLMTLASRDVDSVVLTLVLLLSFPGAPCIYYGTEIGLEGGRDPDCRRAFPWEHEEQWNRRLLETVGQLARLRRRHPALRSGDYQSIWPTEGSEPSGAYACVRSAETERLLVAINAGTATEALPIVGGDGADARVLWAWGAAELDRVGHEARLRMKPRSAALCSAC
ncbi:MAG: glycoside hydrolase family 13 protein [Deltaproteobacteria bacterium]|nr:glycoside hydrolase family 13 protein [Deltaproteobacteria bacterium]MBW2535412.1 glycoside hydrolase family 13 protein [Deltaproteobacteria bacterium]